MRNLYNGGPVYGGTFPAIIFKNYMDAALAGQRPSGSRRRRRPRPRRRWACGVVGLSQETARRCWPGPGSAARSSRSAAPSPRGGWSARRPARGPACARAAPSSWPSRPAAAAAGTTIVPGVVGLGPAWPGRSWPGPGWLRPRLHQQRPPGRVAAQSPGAGAQLPSGSYVTWSWPAELAAEALQHQAADLVAVGAALDLGHEAAHDLAELLGPLAPEAATASSTSRASSAGSRPPAGTAPAPTARRPPGRPARPGRRPGRPARPRGACGPPAGARPRPRRPAGPRGRRWRPTGADRASRRAAVSRGSRAFMAWNIACCTSSMSMGRAYSYNPLHPRH